MSIDTPSATNFITPEEAADQLGVALQTLANWRTANKGPAFYRVGRSIMYRRIDLDDFKQGCRVETYHSRQIESHRAVSELAG